MSRPTNRRAVLRGLAVLPAAGALTANVRSEAAAAGAPSWDFPRQAAAANLPTGQVSHPDAALLALGARLDALLKQLDAAQDRQWRLWATYAETEPAKPDALRCRWGDGDLLFPMPLPVGAFFTAERMEMVREHLAAGMETFGPRFRPRAEVRGAELVAAWDAWEAACQVHADAIGLTAVRRRIEALAVEIKALQLELIAQPVATLAGFRVKAEVVAGTPGDIGKIELTRDVLALVAAIEGGAA